MYNLICNTNKNTNNNNNNNYNTLIHNDPRETFQVQQVSISWSAGILKL